MQNSFASNVSKFQNYFAAKGLRVGAEQIWSSLDKKPTEKGGPITDKPPADQLLFLCDVDVVFSAKFLDRCRWNTKPNRKVSFINYNPFYYHVFNYFNNSLKGILSSGVQFVQSSRGLHFARQRIAS